MPGPLFVMENKKPLTRQRFYSSLAAVLEQSGLNHRNYNTHSFRIGAATTARHTHTHTHALTHMHTHTHTRTHAHAHTNTHIHTHTYTHTHACTYYYKANKR